MTRTLRIYSVNNFHIQQVNYINHIIHYIQILIIWNSVPFDHLLKKNNYTTQRYKDLHKDTNTQEMVSMCNNIFFLLKKYF